MAERTQRAHPSARIHSGRGSRWAWALGRRRACLQRAPSSGSAQPQSSTTAGAAKQPRSGGSLNHATGTAGGFDSLGLTFDPHIQGLSAEQSYTLFYERLLGYNPLTYKVEPEIGQKWELISPTEYRFTLQPA